MSGQIDEAEVARIAATLSRDEKRALTIGISVWGGQFDGAASWQKVGRALRDLGLIRLAPDPRSSETYQTSFGLAVRKHLEAQR